MAVRPILLYGDQRLVAENAAVESFGRDLDELLLDMRESCWAAPGLGLAAPQIGINLRLAIVDLSAGRDPDGVIVLANPRLVASAETRRLEEGCLSFPGLYATLSRPSRVTVAAQDEAGKGREIEADGTLAQAFCHELDHLDGVLLPDRLRGPARYLFLLRVRWARRRWPEVRTV